jgi:hypothetical protein
MIKLWISWEALVFVRSFPVVKQRICTDAELALLSLQQSIQGGNFNNCIEIDPRTKLATSVTLKACLMSAGATELCASCFASMNDAFSQCIPLCDYGSETPSTDCTQCMNAIQTAYELTDDQMLQLQLYDICRTGFADDKGIMHTTGIPPTTSIPSIAEPIRGANYDTSWRGSPCNGWGSITGLIAILLNLLIN